MDITYEIYRLAELHKEGHLTEQEFADANRQLFSQGNAKPLTVPKKQNDNPSRDFVPLEEKTYKASRWTSGKYFACNQGVSPKPAQSM
jgi:hypothetical protein